MSQIITLDPQLANQIAAGEVVERPLSVVKELVENALDAWACNISIKIEEWGISFIEVSDDGVGIRKDELPLALEKYSTSKIKDLEDLHHVMTFWFRGEALASIASISKFLIASKHEDDTIGYCFSGQNLQQDSISQWTKVQVRELFYNTPARLNYLKKPRTEYNHVHDFVQKIALSHPKVGVRFLSDDTEICNFRAGETLKDRIYSIYGKEFSQNTIELSFSYNGIQLQWYITDPKVSFSNKNKQCLFVNHRIIQAPLIYKAIIDGYNRFIPHGTFPWYVLNIQIDPTQVDVNVHPRKMEVRFANEQSIYRVFYHWVKDALEKVSLSHVPKVSEAPAFSHPVPTEKFYTGSWTKFKSYSPYTNTQANPKQGQIQDSLQFSQAVSGWFEQSTDLHDTPLWKIVGQVHNSYIAVETPQGIQLLDQHAVAERVLFEKISKDSYTPAIQKLLVWETCELTPKEKSIFEQGKEVFTDMGFDIEALSWNTLLINGIPDFIKKENIQDVFFGILEDTLDAGNSKTLEEVRNRIYAYTACRSAIKFGDSLTLFEMNKLLRDASLDYSATCPHGRPVIWEIGLEELKKKYER